MVHDWKTTTDRQFSYDLLVCAFFQFSFVMKVFIHVWFFTLPSMYIKRRELWRSLKSRTEIKRSRTWREHLAHLPLLLRGSICGMQRALSSLRFSISFIIRKTADELTFLHHFASVSLSDTAVTGRTRQLCLWFYLFFL